MTAATRASTGGETPFLRAPLSNSGATDDAAAFHARDSRMTAWTGITGAATDVATATLASSPLAPATDSSTIVPGAEQRLPACRRAAVTLCDPLAGNDHRSHCRGHRADTPGPSHV